MLPLILAGVAAWFLLAPDEQPKESFNVQPQGLQSVNTALNQDREFLDKLREASTPLEMRAAAESASRLAGATADLKKAESVGQLADLQYQLADLKMRYRNDPTQHKGKEIDRLSTEIKSFSVVA